MDKIKNYKLAIFDLDGTLLDTLKDLQLSLNFSLQNNNFRTCTFEEVKRFVGHGIKRLVEDGAPNATSEQIERLYSDFVAYYSAHCTDNTVPYAGVLNTLVALKNTGIKIAVVSNKRDVAVKELCKKYFDNIVDLGLGENENHKRKPSPDMVLFTMNYFNLPKENCVYIGDSEVDIETAKNAEIDCISVCWGFREKQFLIESGAKIIVENATQLLNCISDSKMES